MIGGELGEKSTLPGTGLCCKEQKSAIPCFQKAIDFSSQPLPAQKARIVGVGVNDLGEEQIVFHAKLQPGGYMLALIALDSNTNTGVCQGGGGSVVPLLE